MDPRGNECDQALMIFSHRRNVREMARVGNTGYLFFFRVRNMGYSEGITQSFSDNERS